VALTAPGESPAAPETGFAAAAPGRSPRHGRLAAYTACCGVALLVCADALRPGRAFLGVNPFTIPPWTEFARPAAAQERSNPLMVDGLVLTYPARAYNRQRLLAGELPLWNPHILCGYPHLAHIQNHALHPLTAPFDLVSPEASMGWSLVLHLALAGILMFHFALGSLRLSYASALLGGLAFELNGFFLTRLAAPSYVFSGAWLPLLLMGADTVARTGRLSRGWPFALGTALSALGGHPQVVALSLGLAAAYTIWVAGVESSGGLGSLTRRVVWLLVLMTLGLVIACVQLVPFGELILNSARSTVPFALYRTAALPAAALLQTAIPDLFGNPVQGDYWFAAQARLLDGMEARLWPINYCGENLYTGVATLALAGLAVWRARSFKSRVFFFAVVEVLTLAAALGTPALRLVHDFLPGFAYSRPDRILFLHSAALACLSGYGMESLLRVREPRPRPGPRWAVALSVAAIVSTSLMPSLWSTERRSALAAWIAAAVQEWSTQRQALWPQMLVLFLALLLLGGSVGQRRRCRVPAWSLVALWLALLVGPNVAFSWRFNPAVPTPPARDSPAERLGLARTPGGRVARVLDGLFLPANTAQLVGLDDANGTSAAGLASYFTLIGAADPASIGLSKYLNAFHWSGALDRLLDLLSVETVFSDRTLPLPEVGRSGSIRIYRNPDALPRFFLVRRVETYAEEAGGLGRLLSPSFDPRTTALLKTGASVLPARDDPAPAGTVLVERLGAEEVHLLVEAPRGGLLVSSEIDYPGWTALIDGTRAPVVRVNVAFRGVVVPPGSRAVRFVYSPASFRWGVALSCAGLVGFLGLVARDRRERRKSGQLPLLRVPESA
jgi:hypothetical protein